MDAPLQSQWSLKELANIRRPTPEQKEWAALRILEEMKQTKAKPRGIILAYGFKYPAVRKWISKVKSKSTFSTWGGSQSKPVDESLLMSCPLAVELRRQGLTLFEPVSELPARIKPFIAKEYLRGSLSARAIARLVGIKEKFVYEYTKLFKKKGSKFTKSVFGVQHALKAGCDYGSRFGDTTTTGTLISSALGSTGSTDNSSGSNSPFFSYSKSDDDSSDEDEDEEEDME